MGGTSTDAALIDGELRLTDEGRIGPYPVTVPMVDMHTIGAGGGSIARLDAGGLLHVGPESAGAEPGPTCYGRGGRDPTVTDANVVLGRLPADRFLGGSLPLDVDAAHQAVARIAGPLGLSIEEAALGIVRVANEHMARALRVISQRRGIDPRPFTLFSFGGAGGLHVCALAESLDMRQALVPIHAGVLSALGMLAAPRGRRLSRTLCVLLEQADEQTVAAAFSELERQGIAELRHEGVSRDGIHTERAVDLRYRGQSSTLALPWQDAVIAAESFHQAHVSCYGHRLDLPIELVNLRVAVRGPRPLLPLRSSRIYGADHAPKTANIPGAATPVPVLEREALRREETLHGPAIITEATSTTYLAPGWRCKPDAYGNLVLAR
jgi:N-methylhydantoinase A